MNFKYRNEIEELGLEECPPIAYKKSAFTAYRFIFSDLEHPNNFTPLGLTTPKRLNDFKENIQKCQSFGLSMFSDSEKALMKFKYLQKKTAGKFVKTVGNNLATINLEITDGVHSDLNLNSSAHFTFHEFEKANLIKRIVHVETCDI